MTASFRMKDNWLALEVKWKAPVGHMSDKDLFLSRCATKS